MQVRAGGLTSCSDEAKAGAGRDTLSELHVDSREMRVERANTGTVLDDDEVSPAAGMPAREHDYGPRRRRTPECRTAP